MIFFFKSDGTLIKSAPETVYQGSEEAGKVYVVAPLNANMLVDVYYELPNGERWGAYLLENNGTVINNEELPDGWALWSTTLESAITQYAGTLKAQFGFYQSGTADKVPLITSQGVTITIAKGVVRDLPSVPTSDVYAQIVNAISSIKQDIANLPNEYLSNTNEDKIALKNNSAIEYSENATAGTIVKRDSNGKINVADGTEDLNAVNIRQFNAALAGIGGGDISAMCSFILGNNSPFYPNFNTQQKTLTFPTDTGIVDNNQEVHTLTAQTNIVDYSSLITSAIKVYLDKSNNSLIAVAYSEKKDPSQFVYVCSFRVTTNDIKCSINTLYLVNGEFPIRQTYAEKGIKITMHKNMNGGNIYNVPSSDDYQYLYRGVTEDAMSYTQDVYVLVVEGFKIARHKFTKAGVFIEQDTEWQTGMVELSKDYAWKFVLNTGNNAYGSEITYLTDKVKLILPLDCIEEIITYKGADVLYPNEYYGEKVKLAKNKFDYKQVATITINSFEQFSGVSTVPQSLCIYGDYIFIFFTNGYVGIISRTDYSVISSYRLNLTNEQLATLHCSNVSWGVEFPTGNTTFPALYVCETMGTKKCYVFSVTISGSTLIQTITFDGTFGKTDGNNYRDFIVDRERNIMYLVGYYDYDKSDNYTIIKKINMPLLSAGAAVSLGNDDVIYSFDIPYVKVIQGCFIYNNKLFIANNSGLLPKGIVVVDLELKAFSSNIPTAWVSEPEGIDTTDGYMILQDVNGEIYKVDFA